MEATKILSADLLDIIFEGRNQAYGAFELRKQYPKRLVYALAAVILLIGLSYTLYLRMSNDVILVTEQIIPDPELRPIANDPVPAIPKPPATQAPRKQASIPLATFQFTHDEVSDADRPARQDLPDDATIGLVGDTPESGNGIDGPPTVFAGQGIVDAPKPAAKVRDTIFTRVEIESTYPGGPSAWQRYLNKTFRYPVAALDEPVQGTVIVQFVVDETGLVSHVEALSGPTTGGLREEAQRVIQRSGRWEPAIQNGRQVKSYKSQPITFTLE